MSNKMPSGLAAKTALVLRDSVNRTLIAALLFMTVPVLIWGYVNFYSDSSEVSCNQLAGLESEQVSGQGFSIKAYVTEDKAKGLGGVACLNDNDGMLFVYNSPGNYCYWMKDMLISIDMIWLDEQKQVIDIKDNVAPETYPASFCPSSPAKYVLETNAGKASRIGLKVGDRVKF